MTEYLKKEIAETRNLLRELKKKRYKYIVDNKLFVNLDEYEGKSLLYITALDANGDIVPIPDDEFLDVKNGHLHASSYQQGVLNFMDGKYIHSYYGYCEELPIAGFCDIGVE